MSSASNVSGRRFRSNGFLLALVCVLSGSASVQAQMFSVKPERDRVDLPGVRVSMGLERTEVASLRPVVALPYTDFGFSGDLFRVQLETGGLAASYSLGRGLGANRTDYTSFELTLASDIGLFRRERVDVRLPVDIFSVNTTMTSTAAQVSSAEFRQNALGVRSGLQTDLRFGSRTRLELFGTGGYAFSANGFNSNGGNVTQWDAGVRLHADAVVRSFGFSTGVLAHQRRYDVDVKAFNYEVTSVSFLLGVSF